MEKTDSLSKKLIAYSGLASVILCGVKNADGQIIYHDVVPDKVLANGGDGFQLDLNNNGVADIGFAKYSSSSATSSGENNFSVYVYGFNVYNRVSEGPLNLNDPIDSNLAWAGFSVLNFYHWNSGNPIHTGAWINVTNKFLPLKHVESGHSYFGWARLSAGFGTIQISDWAMDTIPDQQIFAGDSGAIALPVQNVSSNSDAPGIRVRNSSILVTFAKTSNTPAQFTIFDMIGRMRYESIAQQSTKEISIADLEAGEYLLGVESEKSKVVFRFFKD